MNAAGKLFDYTDPNDLTVWLDYVHLGAGIESMTQPLERITNVGSDAALLDVGCGFGFTLDYWRATRNGLAVGIEPTGIGRLGSRELGVDVRSGYLEQVDGLATGTFDVVLSSEVIEHVADPIAFLLLLRGYLSERGVLVLTTPSAEFVTPEAPPRVLLSTLSIGFHRLLLSKHALSELLRHAGFRFVQVERNTERLTAFASDYPLDIRPPDERMKIRYVDYLQNRAGAPDLGPGIQIGLCFRAFKELVSQGKIEAARRFSDRLREEVLTQFDLDICDETSVRERMSVVSALSPVPRVPYCFGPFLFYSAVADSHGPGSHRVRQTRFELAMAALEFSLAMPKDLQEAASLYWVAKKECGISALLDERREEAVGIFETILTWNEDPRARSARFPQPGPDLLASVLFQRSIAHLQLGNLHGASAGFIAVQSDPAASAEDRQHARDLLAEIASLQDGREVPAGTELGASLAAELRCIADLVNGGSIDDARRHEEHFRDVVLDAYELDVFDLDATRELRSQIGDAAVYERRVPPGFGRFLYYRAMATRQSTGAYQIAEDLFGLAADWLQLGLRFGAGNRRDDGSLYWRARFESGCAALIGQRRREAILCFESILSWCAPTGHDDPRPWLPEPGLDILVRTKLEWSIAHLQLGNARAAADGLLAVRSDPAVAPSDRKHAGELLLGIASSHDDVARAVQADGLADC